MDGRSKPRLARCARGLLVGAVAALVWSGCVQHRPDGAEVVAGPLIIVDVTRSVGRFDRRLLGTNVPAWLGSDLLASERFRRRTVALGTTVLRMPGGSWSNYYEWDRCESGDPCPFEGAARPRDFLDHLAATGLEGMWTANVNGTAEEAAALVAYFNGAVGDERIIGVDRNGRDWGTVSDAARRRVAAGHPDPVPIFLWEVGNEVYAARGPAGCAEWGWETVWTCDGAAYVAGDDTHDGYLAFREAMRRVDPRISVGAVGVEEQSAWGDWGHEVIDGAGTALDFYSIHQYPYTSAVDLDTIVDQPRRTWSAIMSEWVEVTGSSGPSTAPPVAVTEYNLVAQQDGDTGRLMTRAVNALFVADSIGQMATHGVAMANQWNLANGRSDGGTDYGMIDVDTLARNPQYYGMAIWRNFGSQLLDVGGTYDENALGVYASLTVSGAITLVAVNRHEAPIAATITLESATGMRTATVETLVAAALGADDVTWNGSIDPSDDLAVPAPTGLGQVESTFRHEFPPFSVSLIDLEIV